MAIIACDNGGGDFKLIPQGTHVAICYLVADLGKQSDTWQGQSKTSHKIFIRWELPNEIIEWEDKDGVKHSGPMVTGKKYTLSLGANSNLRADLESWRGRSFTAEELKAFDVSKLLGAPCMVTVVHQTGQFDGKVRDKVTGVVKLPKGMEVPAQPTNSLLLYDDENRRAYDDLPGFVQKWIDDQIRPLQKGEEGHIPGYDADLDDDVPF